MPAAVLDVDLERSWLEDLTLNLDDRIKIDRPGKLFRIKGRDQWIQPRFLTFSPQESDLRAVHEDVRFRIICYSKVESKGERTYTLSELVDEVKRVIDPRRTTRNFVAGVVRIKNCDGEEVGILTCSPPSQRRAYNQSAKDRDEPVEGLDVAILTVDCKLTNIVCG